MSYPLVIVWLDIHADEPVSSFRDKLMHDQHEYVKIFADSQSCVTFIQSEIHKKIFFILSGSFGSEVVPIVYDLQQVQQIYLFCGTILSHVNWAIDYTDKMYMFDHENDLLERLYREVEAFLRERANFYLQQANLFRDRVQNFTQGSCG